MLCVHPSNANYASFSALSFVIGILRNWVSTQAIKPSRTMNVLQPVMRPMYEGPKLSVPNTELQLHYKETNCELHPT